MHSDTVLGTQFAVKLTGCSLSHFAVHTWPELEYAAIDLFTCGEKWLSPEAALPIFEKYWGATASNTFKIMRGTDIA